ncbi:hypothetical protein MCERE19_03237 [Spirosomataceae bacterium]|jgi:hypothetical protein
MELELKYFKMNLNNIPFEKIKGLENLKYQNIICSQYPMPLNDKMYMVTTYDCFDCLEFDTSKLEVLFGPVYSDNLPTRGVNKCSLILKTKFDLALSELPHLRYTSKIRDDKRGNWYYCKDGKYYIFAAIETTYEKAKHLEPITYYGDWVIRLRMVFELIKKRIKYDGLTYSKEELDNIAYIILKAEPTLNRLDEEEIWNGVHNWVGSMMFTPLYEDIPMEIRGKVLE